jgi:hypothetical protein
MHPPNQSTWAMVLIGFVGIGMTCRRLRGGLLVFHICDANAGLLNNEPDISFVRTCPQQSRLVDRI